MTNKHVIPAASVVGIDLRSISARDPERAREIERLGHLLHEGEETPEDFVRLAELLVEVGETAVSEYLLRCNAEIGDELYSLYLKMHGTDRIDEFREAVNAFSDQFNVEISAIRAPMFLDEAYCYAPRQEKSVRARLEWFDVPGEVRIDYACRDAPMAVAETCGDGSEAPLALKWKEGAWTTVAHPGAEDPDRE